MSNGLIKSTFIAAAFATLASGAFAQEETDPSVEITRAADELATLMEDLQTRSEGYGPFIEQLNAGLVEIEQADERVNELIALLTEATDRMEDGSEFDTLIDDYKVEIDGLISEARGSSDARFEQAIPGLEETLANLEVSDADRAATVIEARNLIRVLNDDRELIAFYIRARQTQLAATLIAENVTEFQDIVARGQAIATEFIESSAP